MSHNKIKNAFLSALNSVISILHDFFPNLSGLAGICHHSFGRGHISYSCLRHLYPFFATWVLPP